MIVRRKVWGRVERKNENVLNRRRDRAAIVPTASMPEPHRRLIVEAGTSCGSPASSSAMRATLRLSSPAWLAQP
jgi:hypothetical protein